MTEKDWSKEKPPEGWTPDSAKEHISPEGVEEKIVIEDRFLITFTQGGKFRLYHIVDDKVSRTDIHETYGEAAQSCATGMAIVGALKIDAEGTVGILIDGLKGEKQ